MQRNKNGVIRSRPVLPTLKTSHGCDSLLKLNLTLGYATGAIKSAFTVDASGNTVMFAMGNLYAYSKCGSESCTNYVGYVTWKFAAKQYDILGESSAAKGYTNSENLVSGNLVAKDRYKMKKWIDLFAWATSMFADERDAGVYYFHFYNVAYATSSKYDYNYFGYGPSTWYSQRTNPYPDLTGTSANYDWGVYNAIENGGNKAGLWRTPSKDEYYYILNTRKASTVNGVANARYAMATVNSQSGLILFPDVYTHPASVPQPNNINNSSGGNTYTADQWTLMENAGAIFLPAGGWCRSGSSWYQSIAYWTSTHCSTSTAYFLYGTNLQCGDRADARNVRLIQDNVEN